MIFASPLWLLGLLPWLGVTLYLLWGRRKRWDVPFLELWRGPAAVEHVKWKVSAPPIALALALLSMLAAILAAARPGANWAVASGSAAIVVVVDRGISMSARGDGDLRFREAGRNATTEIASAFGSDVPIDLWIVPARPQQFAANHSRLTGPREFAGSLDGLPATALDAADAVRVTVRRSLAAGHGPVVVVSDAVIGIDDPRLVQVVPRTPLRNVGIERFSARASPRPQVMVRVRNDSQLTSAALEVSVDQIPGAPTRQAIDLPPAGTTRDYFIDAQRFGPVLSARLIVSDDLDADNQAWLVLESAWPRVELAEPAGGLSRLLDVYAKLRPPSDSSRIVRITGSPGDLRDGESGIIVDVGDGSVGSVWPTRIVPHPVTDAVKDWTRLVLPVTGASPPADFTPILLASDHPLVAVHDGSAASRQIWVGIDPAGWSDRPQYVAFWTAAIDWAGGADAAGDQYAAHPLANFDASWTPADNDKAYDPGTWPGLYKRGDGQLRAFSASPPSLANLARYDPTWPHKLAQLRQAGPGYRDLSFIPLFLSLVLLLLTAATWRKASLARSSPLLVS